MAKKILIIDDDHGILEGFHAILDDLGHDIVLSADADYIDKLKKDEYPDLIILDILISGRDGRDICRKIKKQKDMKKIPIIMMTAAPNVEKSAKEAGADDFLEKPFNMDDLLMKVSKYIGTGA